MTRRAPFEYGIGARVSKTILITGCRGLVVSECAKFFDELGWTVQGIDKNRHTRVWANPKEL